MTLLREWAATIAGANPPRDRVPRRRLAAIAGPALALGVTAVVVAFFVFAEPARAPQQAAAPSNATSSTATATATGSAPAGLPAPSTTAPSSGPSSIATAATPTTATAAVPSPPAGDSAPATTSSPALPALAANRPQMLAWTGSRLVYTGTTRGGVGFVTPDAATTPSATVAAVVPTGADPGGLAIGFGSVWVASARDGTVARLDAGTLSPQALITVGRAPVSIATGHDKTWVVNLVDATVSVIDPRTNTVEGTVTVGGEPFGVAVGATAIWVTNAVERDRESDRSDEPVGVGDLPRRHRAGRDRRVAGRRVGRQPGRRHARPLRPPDRSGHDHGAGRRRRVGHRRRSGVGSRRRWAARRTRRRRPRLRGTG